MAYPVNEAHRALQAEADRLLRRMGLPAPAGVMPIGDGYLFLVPALQAIVDRLEALEAARLRELERRLERLEQSAHGHDFSARVATPLDPVMEAQRRATDAAGRDEPI